VKINKKNGDNIENNKKYKLRLNDEIENQQNFNKKAKGKKIRNNK
jgi:hypothetical protein